MQTNAAKRNPRIASNKFKANKTAEVVPELTNDTTAVIVMERNEKKFNPAAMGTTINIFPKIFR